MVNGMNQYTCVNEWSEKLPPYHNQEKECHSSNWCILAQHGVEIDLSRGLPILFGFGTQGG